MHRPTCTSASSSRLIDPEPSLSKFRKAWQENQRRYRKAFSHTFHVYLKRFNDVFQVFLSLFIVFFMSSFGPRNCLFERPFEAKLAASEIFSSMEFDNFSDGSGGSTVDFLTLFLAVFAGGDGVFGAIWLRLGAAQASIRAGVFVEHWRSRGSEPLAAVSVLSLRG